MPLAAIDYRDVIQPQEATFENVVPLVVHLVDPPCKIDQQFVKTLLKPIAISPPASYAIHVVDSPASPRVHWRIQVREFPFIGRELAVGMLELFEQEQPQLFLRELRVDQR